MRQNGCFYYSEVRGWISGRSCPVEISLSIPRGVQWFNSDFWVERCSVDCRRKLRLVWNSNACGKGRTNYKYKYAKRKQNRSIFSSCWNPSNSPPTPNTPCHDLAVFFFFFLLLALTEKQHAITFLKQPSWNLCQMSVERELTYETLLHDGNSTPFA